MNSIQEVLEKAHERLQVWFGNELLISTRDVVRALNVQPESGLYPEAVCAVWQANWAVVCQCFKRAETEGMNSLHVLNMKHCKWICAHKMMCDIQERDDKISSLETRKMTVPRTGTGREIEESWCRGPYWASTRFELNGIRIQPCIVVSRAQRKRQPAEVANWNVALKWH